MYCCGYPSIKRSAKLGASAAARVCLQVQPPHRGERVYHAYPGERIGLRLGCPCTALSAPPRSRVRARGVGVGLALG